LYDQGHFSTEPSKTNGGKTVKIYKSLILQGLLTLLIIALAGCAGAEAPEVSEPAAVATPKPVSVVDDAGRTVEIAKTPQRIISLAPSNTEILFALGLGDKVVGVTDFCDYPEEAKAIEKVGGIEPNLEKLVDLNPDLVLAIGGSAAQVEKATEMEKLGLTVLVLEPGDIEGIMANIELVGQATGAEKVASQLVAQMRERFDDITTKAEGAGSSPKVFFELDATDPSKPYTPGPGSFIDALISLAGGSNIGASAKMQWAQLSTEEIIARDPEVIILGDVNYGVTVEMVKERPGWLVITAVKNGAIYPIDDILVSRPGPRIIDGLEALARIIHPELFE
jgi:iron complex transport system substrate-binding protein